MTEQASKIGKIDIGIFREFLLHRLGHPDPAVIVPPDTGIDAGVIDLGDGRALVIAEDPIFAIPGQPLEMFGWYTVHIGASDVAVMGVKPQYMTYSLLLPPKTPEKDFRTIVDSIHKAALDLGIAIVGGHTGYYPGFASPTIGGVTVFSLADKQTIITPAGARPGNDVLLTKGPAIETAAILSVVREKELRGKYPDELIEKAQALCHRMSVVRDAEIAKSAGGVTAMHDATEGGVIGGLFEIADASDVGMRIEESRFIYPPEIRMVCDAFGIDPVTSIAEGSMLLTAEHGASPAIIRALADAGIEASVIGVVTSDRSERLFIRRDRTIIPLVVPKQDPFWPVFFAGLS
jgi:hydrogenase maturation factor